MATRCCCAARERAGQALAKRPRRQPSRHSLRARASQARVQPATAAQFQRQQHVFQRRQRRHQLEELEDDADMSAPPACQRVLALLAQLPPAKTMRPLVGRSMPVSRLSNVDLPLPDGPLMAKRLCAGTAKVISCKMGVFGCVSRSHARDVQLE